MHARNMVARILPPRLLRQRGLFLHGSSQAAGGRPQAQGRRLHHKQQHRYRDAGAKASGEQQLKKARTMARDDEVVSQTAATPLHHYSLLAISNAEPLLLQCFCCCNVDNVM